MKTGLSLSFCVADIARGKVNIGDVKKIVCSTKFRNWIEFTAVLASYSTTYWKHLPSSWIIATTLYLTGRLEQPRLTGGTTPNISNGHWTDID